MAVARMIRMGLVLLLPATAALGAEGRPTLHVDPSLEDCSVRLAPELTQAAFGRFAREFGSVSAFKQASPPTTLGRGGFSAGVEDLFFSVDERSAAWNDTFAHPAADHYLGNDKSIPKLRLRVGVTDDLDVGAFYAQNPEANYGWVGVEAKYALLQQREDMPVTLAVRGAYTKTLFVRDMDMHALGVDVSVGRTFWKIVTPYLGVGADAILARETTDAVDLDPEAPGVTHLTGGLEVRWWHVAVGAEAQLAARAPASFQAQVSAVF